MTSRLASSPEVLFNVAGASYHASNRDNIITYVTYPHPSPLPPVRITPAEIKLRNIHYARLANFARRHYAPVARLVIASVARRLIRDLINYVEHRVGKVSIFSLDLFLPILHDPLQRARELDLLGVQINCLPFLFSFQASTTQSTRKPRRASAARINDSIEKDGRAF